MDIRAQQIIAPRLRPGERLLWAGRPRRGIVFRSSDLFVTPFSIFWGVSAIYTANAALRSRVPLFFRITGLFFVAVGIYLMIGRFFLDAWRRGRTYYGLTDRRIVIASGLARGTLRSFDLSTLADLSLKETRGGLGTIALRANIPRAVWFGGGTWPGAYNAVYPTLEMIERPRDVYDRIRDAIRASALPERERG